MSEELDVLTRQAEKKKAELAAKESVAPEVEDAYLERFLYASIYNSLAIEGNQLTEEEVERVLKNNEVIAGKSLSDHLCVVGYRDSTLQAQKYAKSLIRISEHEIRKLHYQLLIDQQAMSGEYRSYNHMVRGHRPTSYEKIGYKMLQLVENYGSLNNENPIEATAFFHLRLEKIHPFCDGNGRVGRIIINLMLEAAGYPGVIIPVTEKDRYYAALAAYDGLKGNPDIKPMQVLLAERVNAQLDELLAL